jgi:hypothetical protein
MPFCLVLTLTILGVAYTSFSRRPILAYWEVLAPIIGVVCVASGWHNAQDSAARRRLLATQALHWLAFVVVMNVMLLPSVQRNFSANAAGLAVFTLLTLGTFTAGVHVLAWQICLLGLIMVLCIPAMAWIENSALLFLSIAVGLLGVAALFWPYWQRERRQGSQAVR